MINREDLQKRYSSLTNSELMEIVDNKYSYTDLAVLIAMEELSKRILSEEDIKNYKLKKEKEVETFIIKNVVADLTFFQKNLFFYIWIPFLNFLFKRTFLDNGYELKLIQAKYYSWLGFSFCFILIMIQSNLDFSISTFFIIWMITFLISFLFDEYFNRQSQIRKLRRIFKIPEDEK